MTMVFVGLASIGVSAAIIVLLCLGDPKRQRSLGRPGPAMPAARRRLLAVAACMPGLVCALLGDAAAFLMWLGGCALIGWAVAAWLRSARQAD